MIGCSFSWVCSSELDLFVDRFDELNIFVKLPVKVWKSAGRHSKLCISGF